MKNETVQNILGFAIVSNILSVIFPAVQETYIFINYGSYQYHELFPVLGPLLLIWAIGLNFAAIYKTDDPKLCRNLILGAIPPLVILAIMANIEVSNYEPYVDEILGSTYASTGFAVITTYATIFLLALSAYFTTKPPTPKKTAPLQPQFDPTRQQYPPQQPVSYQPQQPVSYQPYNQPPAQETYHDEVPAKQTVEEPSETHLYCEMCGVKGIKGRFCGNCGNRLD